MEIVYEVNPETDIVLPVGYRFKAARHAQHGDIVLDQKEDGTAIPMLWEAERPSAAVCIILEKKHVWPVWLRRGTWVAVSPKSGVVWIYEEEPCWHKILGVFNQRSSKGLALCAQVVEAQLNLEPLVLPKYDKTQPWTACWQVED